MTIRRLALFLPLLLCWACGPATSKVDTVATAPDEAAAITTLKQVNQAQQDFIRQNRRYALTYDELIQSHLLDKNPAALAIGYDIQMRPSADAESYTLTAAPLTTPEAVRHFFTDQTGILRGEMGKPAGLESPEL